MEQVLHLCRLQGRRLSGRSGRLKVRNVASKIALYASARSLRLTRRVYTFPSCRVSVQVLYWCTFLQSSAAINGREHTHYIFSVSATLRSGTRPCQQLHYVFCCIALAVVLALRTFAWTLNFVCKPSASLIKIQKLARCQRQALANFQSLGIDKFGILV